MPNKDKPHHIILIIALLIMYLLFLLFGLNILMPFFNGSHVGIYIVVSLISLAIGTAIFKLYHETEYNKKPLYRLFFITNVIIAGLMAMNVFVYTIVTRLSGQLIALDSTQEHFVSAHFFGTMPDPYILGYIVFSFFNIFYLAHLFEEKRKRELLFFIIPVIGYLILVIIFKYIATRLIFAL